MHQQIPSSNPKELQILSGKFTENDTPDHGIFLLSGDASAGNIACLVPAPNVELPELSNNLTGSGFMLTIYHFNDLHGQLAYFTPEGEIPVISKIAWQIRKQRQAIKNAPDQGFLFFSAGDDLIGSIFDELLFSKQNDFQIHPSFHINSAMGMDGACLGNHDFDIGVPLLKASITKNAKYPIFAANLNCPQLENICHPGAIYHVKGVRIGVIGLVTQAEQKVYEPECFITDPLPVAKNLVNLLRPYCDVLIILSHLGYSLANASVPMVSIGDVELANSLPPGSVDLIIGGHSHHELNSTGLSPKNVVNGIPIVQSGSSGRFLGQVDIKVSTRDTAVFNARLISVETLPIDTEFEQKIVQPIVSKARNLFDQSLGITSDQVMNIDDLASTDCDAGEIPMRSTLRVANFITDGLVSRLRHAGIPVDLAMIDSSSVRHRLPKSGTITFGDWFNVMPYADTLRIYTLSGQELLNLINDNSKRVDLPNEPRIEKGFLFFSKELNYTILASDNRTDTRAIEISYNNQSLTEMLEKQFKLVTTDFVRQYCAEWEKSDLDYLPDQVLDLRLHPYQETGLFLRRELVAFIQKVGAITSETGAVCDERIRIVEHALENVNNMTVPQFMSYVSNQEHAMAGSVIAISAAQALALGLACLSISGNKEIKADKLKNHLSEIQARLIEVANQDAEALARHIALRKSATHQRIGVTKDCQAELCDLPVRAAKLSLEAAQILQDIRPSALDRVKDDLEISILLLGGAIRAAILLLDSNLRIWPDSDLQPKYQPFLDALRLEIQEIKPVNHIRPSARS